MVARDKYAEVEFELKYDGTKIGRGFVRLTPVLGSGTSRVASERRWIKGRGNLSERSAFRHLKTVSREISELQTIDIDIPWQASDLSAIHFSKYVLASV